MEGETLSDNLFLISVKLVNKDNQAFSQSYYMTGLDPTALSDVQRTFRGPRIRNHRRHRPYEARRRAKSPHRSHRAKTMLPEGHTFKSVGSCTRSRRMSRQAIRYSTATRHSGSSTRPSSSASPRTVRRPRAARAKRRISTTRPR
ncbi:MAG: hypothetical protein ACLUQ6_09970 [Alistipes onderdonkii]